MTFFNSAPLKTTLASRFPVATGFSFVFSSAGFVSALFVSCLIIPSVCIPLVFLASPVQAQEVVSPTEEARHKQDADKEDHEQLIALRETATRALHDRDYDTLVNKVVAKEFSLTTATQKHFNSIDSFKSYYEGLFVGPSAVLKAVELRPVADSKTRLIGENVGVVQGSSQDTYKFSESDVRTMPTRWSATVVKEDGQWRVASLHIGADFSDNPVIDVVTSMAKRTAVGTFIVGMLVGWIVGRRRKA